MNKLLLAAAGVAVILSLSALAEAHPRREGAAGDFDVARFGAKADGVTDDTAALQKAIDAAAEAGGGRVVVKAGDYRSGSLRLKSHVEFRLEKGATIVGGTKSDDYFDFPVEVCSVRPENSSKVFLYGWDLEDVAITGEGVIEGRGPEFFDRSKLAFGGSFWGKPPHPRPRMVQLVRCKGVRLEGVTFKDSPGWTMLVRLCEDVTAENIKVIADQRIINSDGIDFDGCRRVRVRRSTFKTGDDCLIVRSMRERGCRDRIVSEDIVFEDCDLDSACQTIRMGCPSDDVIRNVRIRNIRGKGQNGINFDYPARYLRPDDEGYMDLSDVLIEDFIGDFYGNALKIVVEPGVKLRRISGVTVRNFTATSKRPIRFVGNADSPLSNIVLENVTVTMPEDVTPWEAVATEPLVLRNCTFNGVRETDRAVVTSRGERQPLVRPSGSWEADGRKAVSDDTARLQALLDSGAGRVTFPDGTFVVSRPLRIGSDTHLVCSPRTVVRLKDGANCPLLMNRSSESGEDHNITVEGGVWDGNNVGQRRGPYRRPKTPGGGDINQLMVFAGVRNLHLKGLTMKDPDSYCAELTDINGFLVEDIVFDCNDKTPNQDGIHVDGFARDGLIRNLRGHTNDDLVALNSDEGNWRSPSNDIVNVTIDGLYGGDDGYTAVRLLSRNAHVENIVIRNVYGRFKYNGVSFTHFAFKDHKPGMGHFDNIVIENMFASNCMKKGGYWGMVYFQEGVESVGRVTVRNLCRVDAPDCLNANYTIRLGEGAKVDTLILDNVEQRLPDDKPLIHRDPNVTIRNLIRR